MSVESNRPSCLGWATHLRHGPERLEATYGCSYPPYEGTRCFLWDYTQTSFPVNQTESLIARRP
jgi:hypothetical protein